MPRLRERSMLVHRMPPALVAIVCALLMAAVSSRQQREARLDALTATQRQQLASARSRLASLDPAEQDRVRRLQAALEAAPDGAELHQVLVRYGRWLATLSPGERAELAKLSSNQRVARLQTMVPDHALRRPLTLTSDDLDELGRWIEERVWRDDRPRHRPGEADRRAMFVGRFLENSPSSGSIRFWSKGLSSEMLEDLAKRLSAEPAARLSSPNLSPSEKRRQVVGWLEQLVRSRLPRVDGDRLSAFFEQELSVAGRDELLSLPPDEMERELQVRYFRAHWGRRPGRPGMGPPGGPDGERPGRFDGPGRLDGPRGPGGGGRRPPPPPPGEDFGEPPP